MCVFGGGNHSQRDQHSLGQRRPGEEDDEEDAAQRLLLVGVDCLLCPFVL